MKGEPWHPKTQPRAEEVSPQGIGQLLQSTFASGSGQDWFGGTDSVPMVNLWSTQQNLTLGEVGCLIHRMHI